MNRAPSAPMLNCFARKAIEMATPQKIMGAAFSMTLASRLLESSGPRIKYFNDSPGYWLMIKISTTLMITPIRMAIRVRIRVKFLSRNFSTSALLFFDS